ncbi:hypothetical protein ACOMHN_023974 [Nucella lapillus]
MMWRKSDPRKQSLIPHFRHWGDLGMGLGMLFPSVESKPRIVATFRKLARCRHGQHINCNQEDLGRKLSPQTKPVSFVLGRGASHYRQIKDGKRSRNRKKDRIPWYNSRGTII